MHRCWTPALSRAAGLRRSLLAVCTLGLAAAAPALAQNPGDLAFTAWNADEDGWTLVALVDLPAAGRIFFTDNDFDGVRFGTGEGFLQWDLPAAGVAEGTPVRFSRIDSATAAAASLGQLQRLWLPGSTAPQLAQAGDTLYAYLGSNAQTPTLFLGAVTTEAAAQVAARLAGTGLEPGRTALVLAPATEFAEYTGPRSFTNLPQWQAAINGASAWTQASGATFALDTPSLAPFTPVPEPAAWWLGLAAAAWLWRRQRTGRARTDPFGSPKALQLCGSVTRAA